MEFRTFSPLNRVSRTQTMEMTLESEVTSVEPVEEDVYFPKVKRKVNNYKLFKIAAKAVGSNGSNSIVADTRTALYEEPPYDFEKIMQAIDTDSYCMSAFNKYQELFWKSGYEIVSENQEALLYLRKRIAFMERTMNRTFPSLLRDMTDHLVKFHNVFVVKHKEDMSDYLTKAIDTRMGDDPITGYFMIPPEKVSIVRNKYNIPLRYKQRLDESIGAGFSGKNDPVWPAEDVIHIHMSRKTGRLYGTPFIYAALDDVIALRQIEQDAQNLVHRELYPIFKYKLEDVNADDPDLPEIDMIIDELENMRTEGSVFLPPGHDVDIVGAGSEVLDIQPYLNHFKERVATGLGVFPHHLGMVDFAGANRDMTDRLDQALYDRVKAYQRVFEEIVTFHIFNELLLDGGFDPYRNLDGENSDQCKFKFKEIDIETMIKVQEHEMQKYAGNLTTTAETRLALGMDPDLDPEDTLSAIQAKISLKYSPPPAAGASGGSSPSSSSSSKSTSSAKKKTSSTPGRPNLPNNTRQLANKIRPQNQHGTRTGPRVRHDDDLNAYTELDDNARELVDLYLEELED